MFTKNHFLFVNSLETDFYHRSVLVKYILYEDDEMIRQRRMNLYNELENQGDFTSKNIVVNSSDTKSEPFYCVIRIIEKRKIAKHDKLDLLLHEYFTRTNLRHSFLINFIDSFQDKRNLYYLTDFASGGYLFTHLRKKKSFSVSECRFYIAQIILAVQYLHSKNLLYRSFFPSNILVTSDGYIKLKFDFLNKQGIPDIYTGCDTIDYNFHNQSTTELSNETKRNENQTNNNLNAKLAYISYDFLKYGDISKESEYWSIGALLFEMFTGESAFYDKDINKTKSNILEQQIYIINAFDDDTEDLIATCLDRNRMRRKEFFKNPLKMQSHSFFHGFSWQDLHDKKIKPPQQFKFEQPSWECEFGLMFQGDTNEEAIAQGDGFYDTFRYYKNGFGKKRSPW